MFGEPETSDTSAIETSRWKRRIRGTARCMALPTEESLRLQAPGWGGNGCGTAPFTVARGEDQPPGGAGIVVRDREEPRRSPGPPAMAGGWCSNGAPGGLGPRILASHLGPDPVIYHRRGEQGGRAPESWHWPSGNRPGGWTFLGALRPRLLLGGQRHGSRVVLGMPPGGRRRRQNEWFLPGRGIRPGGHRGRHGHTGGGWID